MWVFVWGGRSVAPLGLVFMGGRNPALTRWAIVWRPSGPEAMAWEDPKLRRCIGGQWGQIFPFDN